MNKQLFNTMSREDSSVSGIDLDGTLFSSFVLCFTFLWVAMLNSVRRAADVLGAPHTLCIYLHF